MPNWKDRNLDFGFLSLRDNDDSEKDEVILLDGNSQRAISERKSASDFQKSVENGRDKRKTQVRSLHAFDLDHTLLRVNSSFLFSRYLRKLGLFGFTELLFCLQRYMSYRFFKLSLSALHQTSFDYLFFEKPQEAFLRAARAFWKAYGPSLLNPILLKLLKKAQMRGDFCLLMTSSPAFLVSPLVKELRFDAFLATQYAIDSSKCFSHIAHVVDGPAKAQHLKKVGDHLKISQEQTWAYSDSIDDLPLLEMAGHPLLVNPDRRLKALGKKREWKQIA